ncbi:MAG: ABC-F family ATP-binding cassette domain-containing protein [Ignavibacteria bacterium]|nr:ABC-F family ATP-binding cassette domain-containing protein [Ignavibacteria bacterium]
MSTINFNSVTFYYPESAEKVFDNLNLSIDTSWRLGLTGRNGRGKSTLLRLMNKELIPVKGNVFSEINTFYFPFIPLLKNQITLNVIKENIAPFGHWEKMMSMHLNKNDEKSMSEYGKLLDKYSSANGYEINSMIEKEFSELKMDSKLLYRDFSTLSSGEQTRALIITLFLKQNSFPLIDEPTDHLDMNGRNILSEYLSGKAGFILASHDRNFLDKCTDHILAINKSDISISKGNYSQWKHNMDIREEFEIRKNENLKREIKSLESAARKRRRWSDIKEKEKKGATTLKPDKGYLSHKSAKLMKRALHIESRIENKITEKKSLLKNLEDERLLFIEQKKIRTEKLLTVQNAGYVTEGRIIFKNVSFDVRKGDRIALIGNNGCGKTTLIRAILKQINLTEGTAYIPGHFTVSYSRQEPLWNSGYLREHLKNENIDETKFRQIMGVMGAWGELFDRPLETFSKGQIKKAELCKSFLNPGDLLIWDEPLNYLDINSREQLEKVILDYNPTLLFTEHDKKFVDNIATGIIEM